jgi:surfactin synthase thioesterase subunit
LFCFCHAGGNAMVFRPWKQRLAPVIEVLPVQIPGRGGRSTEPLVTRMTALADMTAAALAGYIDRPFAFFGHSMGALLAFEVAHRLRDRRGIEPVHFFASGRRGPEDPGLPPIHILPHDGLVQRLREMNGTPAEVLEHPELLELVVPVFRADAEVLETYEYKPRTPLSCPMTVLGGIGDVDVTVEHLNAWQRYSTGAFRRCMFPGDHFYLLNAPDQVIDVLRQKLLPLTAGLAAR